MSGFTLDFSSLQSHLGDATFKRAREVYVTQQVRPDFKVTRRDGGSWQLESVVGGSNRERYQVEIDMEVDDAGVISSFDSSCSCPVGHNCKHAGALAMKAAYADGGVRQNAPAKPVHGPMVDGAAFAAIERFIAKRNQLAGLVAETSARPPPPPPPSAAEQLDHGVSQWLDLFGASDESQTGQGSADVADEIDASDGADVVLFMLKTTSVGVQQRLQMSCVTTRKLKSGQWGKRRVLRDLSPRRDTPEANEVIQLMQTLARAEERSYYYSGYGSGAQAHLTGETGLLALKLAAATGRLYWGSFDGMLGEPMKFAQPHALTWAWTSKPSPHNTDTLWQLVPSVPDHPNALLLHHGMTVWVDAEVALLGQPQASGMTETRLQALLQTPAIPETSWLRHEGALLRQFAGLPLPPIGNAPVEWRGITPTAQVRIQAAFGAQRTSHGLAFATLRFEYRNDAALDDVKSGFWPHQASPVLLTADAAGPSLAGDAVAVPNRIMLHRDLATENAARHALEALGLSGNRDGRFSGSPLVPIMLQPWLKWADDGFSAFKAAGFDVEVDDSLRDWVARADDLHAHVVGDDADDDSASTWFDLSLGLEIDGQRVNILPVLPSLVAAFGEHTGRQFPDHVFVPHPQDPATRWLRVPTDAIRPWLQALIELLDANPKLAQGDSMRLSRFDLLQLGAGARWSGASRMRELLTKLAGGANALQPVAQPTSLMAALRPYQSEGLSWLQFLRENSLGGILADDMGLGKTVQTLSHILVEKESGRLTSPVLIVCPVSVMGNWIKETARFTPSLKLLNIHGTDRQAQFTSIAAHDIVLTSYALLARDRDEWLKTTWSMVVLDEAQNIKNAHTQAAQVASELRSRQRLCLTGTPLENHLGELWSLFHFLMPGFLGSSAGFKNLFRTPIEKHGDTEQLTRLRQRITPFLLRRSKHDVAVELPDKIESISSVALSGKQADLYETIRLATEKSVRDALTTKGLARSQIQVLDALLKLRQVCCDPRLVPTTSAKAVKESAKLDMLMDMLPQLIEEGRRVLVFSQFTSMLSLIEDALSKRGMRWVKLTGQSQKREAIIERFTSGEVPLFLISLKAGGVGLNLQQADTVIHYDPWWNPAVENQATDRAHRLGQTKQVLVYKLVASGTIEERMLALQERKAALAEGVLSGSQARKQALFTESDVAELLKPLGA